MKKQQVAKNTGKKISTVAEKPKPKQALSEKFVPSPFPNWIYIVIFAFCFALYGNTMLNEYALDDTMVLTQNEFVKQGIDGIPKIFKYDTFIGRYGEQVTNLPGGRYRPLSVALLAVEYELFVDGETKQIIRDKLDPTKTQFTIPRRYLSEEVQAQMTPEQTEMVYTKQPSTPSQNDDDAPLYMKTMLPYVNHFVNILLYVFTACFLFKLLSRLFPVRDQSGWKMLLNIPVIATLLFIAHPVHVEAVANIKGRDEIMTFLGALMALFYTLRWLDTRKTKFLLITFLCFLGGAFAKENALTFLAVIPVTIYFAGQYKLRHLLLFTGLTVIPVFLLLKGQALAFLFVAGFAVMLFAPPKHSKLRTIAWALLPAFAAGLIFTCVRWSIINMDPLPETELMNNPFLGMRNVEKWASIIYGLGRYLWLLIFPHPLTTDYYPYHIPKVVINSAGNNEFINTISIANPAVWAPLLIYGALFALIVWGLSPKRRNTYAYAIVWYLIPLSIVSNVFVMIGTYMNERFVYISSVGFCLALACFLVVHLPQWIKHAKAYRWGVVGFLVVVLSLYSIQTVSRNKAWFDDFTLSTTDVAVSSKSAKSNYDAARVYNIKIQTEPDSAKRAFYTQQIYDYSLKAVNIHPNYENALLMLSWANSSLNKSPDASIGYLVRLVHRNQYNQFVFDALAGVMANNVPDPQVRAKVWEDLLPYAPNRFEPFYYLACVYAKEIALTPEGNYNQFYLEKAVPYFEKAVELNPTHVNGLVDLGAMYGNLGRHLKAVEAFEKAAALAPQDTLIWRNLWLTYSVLGIQDKAQQSYERYVALGGT
jgi:tetratricopeptide (TPR) repeat protein